MCQLLTNNKGLDHEQWGCSWANALVPGHHQLPLLWSLRVRVKDPEFSATCHWLEISLIYWRQIANQLPQGNVFFDCKLKSVNSKLDSRRYRNPELAVIIFMCYWKLPFRSVQSHGHSSSKSIHLHCLWYVFPFLLLFCLLILGLIHVVDTRPFSI